jgi:hypothetical protein
LGKDPHQQTNQIQKQLKELFDNPASTGSASAVTFGGSLRASNSGDSAAAGGSPQGPQPAGRPLTSTRINVLA